MDTDVVVRFVRDDGAELVIDETDWGATEIDGAAAAEYEVFSEDNAVGDGDTITGQRVKARELEISATVMDLAQNQALRHTALAYFNPKRNYKVHLTYMGRTRWISGVLTALKAESAYIYEPQSFTVMLLCPIPYWQSEDDFGQDIAAVTPRWGFPFMDHPTVGVLVSTYNFGRDVVFDYDGDVPGYFRAKLSADSTVVNPRLIKDGFYVRILDAMQQGDVIEIDFERATVTKNGQNILAKIDRTSNFTAMRMEPGVNTVSYAAETGENALHVVLYYNKQYLGV